MTGARTLRHAVSSRMGRQVFQCPSVYHTRPPFSVTTASARGRHGRRSRIVLVLAPEIRTTLMPWSLAALNSSNALVDTYPFWPVLDIGRARISVCRPCRLPAAARIHRMWKALNEQIIQPLERRCAASPARKQTLETVKCAEGLAGAWDQAWDCVPPLASCR